MTIDTNDDDAVLARAAEIAAERKAADDQEQAAALDARRQQYAPLTTLLAFDAFTAARDAASAARDALMTPQTQVVYGILKALVDLMDSIATQVPADVRPAAS